MYLTFFLSILFLIIDLGNTIEFQNFVPHDENQTCSFDQHATPFNTQVRGTNFGGVLVLEPWITPSLFYQFLSAQQKYGDAAPEKTAMDMHSFCTALGPQEGNRQLRIHWEAFVTEGDFQKLYSFGVNSIRVPVGDWMFVPYYPYIGCTDGAIEKLESILDLAEKYNMSVLIDIHGHKGSQNGFDNSGKSHTVKWTSIASTIPIGTTTFEHWPIRTAEWVGTFDVENHNYSSINYDNIDSSLKAVRIITEKYKDHPAVLGIEPINEPWELTPLDVLKDYYWEGYKIVKSIAPRWKYVIHDSFRFDIGIWKGFMKGCPDAAIDTHIYQAWNNPGSKEDYFSNACQQKYSISLMERDFLPVIVGEWSLATDNCAMWLNGFNDNLPGFPKVQCHFIECPESYLGLNFTKDLDRTKPIQGPYGTGVSGPSFGKCPVTSNNFFDIPDREMYERLGRKKVNAFSIGHGYYFWNFKTELDIKWDFIRSVESGFLPRNISDPGAAVEKSCILEDKGDFLCKAKRGVQDYELKSGLAFACNSGVNCTGIEDEYPALIDQCDYAFNKYWHENRVKGATCDFGGAASLQSPPGVTLPPIPFLTPSPQTSLETNEVLDNDLPKPEPPIKIESTLKKDYILYGSGLFVVIVCGAFFAMKKIRKRQGYLPLGKV